MLKGHGTLEAAKLVGLKTVPTITVSGLSDSQKRAFMIADNRLAQDAGWDYEILGASSRSSVIFSSQSSSICRSPASMQPRSTSFCMITAQQNLTPAIPSRRFKKIPSRAPVISGVCAITAFCAGMQGRLRISTCCSPGRGPGWCLQIHLIMSESPVTYRVAGE